MNLPIQQSTRNVFFSRRMLVAFVMGFSGGLPLLLTMGVLQAWMKEGGVDLTWIGMITLVQIPYTWKFLWAPFLDRFIPPFLGRRRGWLLIAQMALMISIAGLGYSDPVKNTGLMIFAALLVAFFSATQDIVIDAYRREDLSDEELGLGSSMYIYGYRLGMLLASGGGLIMADYMSFSRVYFIMAVCLLPGVITTLLTPEPKVAAGAPQTMKAAMIKVYTGRRAAQVINGATIIVVMRSRGLLMVRAAMKANLPRSSRCSAVSSRGSPKPPAASSHRSRATVARVFSTTSRHLRLTSKWAGLSGE